MFILAPAAEECIVGFSIASMKYFKTALLIYAPEADVIKYNAPLYYITATLLFNDKFT